MHSKAQSGEINARGDRGRCAPKEVTHQWVVVMIHMHRRQQRVQQCLLFVPASRRVGPASFVGSQRDDCAGRTRGAAAGGAQSVHLPTGQALLRHDPTWNDLHYRCFTGTVRSLPAHEMSASGQGPPGTLAPFHDVVPTVRASLIIDDDEVPWSLIGSSHGKYFSAFCNTLVALLRTETSSYSYL